MKKRTTQLLLILAIGVLFNSCGKKESDVAPEVGSQMNYTGKSYNLSQGYADVTTIDKLTYVSLYLFTSSLKITEKNNEIDSFSGLATGLALQLILPKNTEGLSAGEYIYDGREDKVNTFSDGAIVLDFDINEDEGFLKEIKAGKITVRKTGDIYEISFDMKDTDGKAITGNYKGKLKIYKY